MEGYSPDIYRLFKEERGGDTPEGKLSAKMPPRELVEFITKVLGGEWLEWEPETVWSEIRRLSGAPVSHILKNKINAAKVLLTSTYFWRDNLVFEKVVLALNDVMPMFDRYQGPSPGMIARAVRISKEIRDLEFSDEVKRYIAVVCLNDGLAVLPGHLEFVKGHLDSISPNKTDWADLVNNKEDEGYTKELLGVQTAKARAVQEYADS